MDPIYKMLLMRFAAKVPEPTNEVIVAIIERLDAQLTEQLASLLSQNEKISAWPPRCVPVPSDAWHAIINAVGTEHPADFQGIAAAIENLEAMTNAQAESLAESRRLLAEANATIESVAREKDLAEREASAMRSQSMTHGEESERRGRELATVRENFRNAANERDDARRLLYQANQELEKLTTDRDEWRALAEGRADDAATQAALQTSAVDPGTSMPPQMIVIDDFEPIAPAPVTPAKPKLGPGADTDHVNHEIRNEETERQARISELFAAVGPMHDIVADRAEVQLGPVSEILTDLLNGGTGTPRQYASRLLKEDGRSRVVASLAVWIDGHFKNLVTLAKPEDVREYRARFTAAVNEAKKAASARRNAKPAKEAA